jgi:hypothetical protein
MKSQPDAVVRMAAEVVTQLPVPSRLGMLRFERLNEPSWALLFLDAQCEKQFGIAAADLCALVGSPYASLMEPEARYAQHDAIQQQLVMQNHYLIRYTLHTASGPLQLLEMGEPYKQHNRQLLRGYLLAAEAADSPAGRARTQPAGPARTAAAPGASPRAAGTDSQPRAPSLSDQRSVARSRRADHP